MDGNDQGCGKAGRGGTVDGFLCDERGQQSQRKNKRKGAGSGTAAQLSKKWFCHGFETEPDQYNRTHSEGSLRSVLFGINPQHSRCGLIQLL
ncbi:hypothetical protein D3C81_1327710 [compost metagenome]